jgi:AraC-like DNA-binding protein
MENRLLETVENAMATGDQYARCVAERTTSPLLTASYTLHWDGLSAVSRSWRPKQEGLPTPPGLRYSLPASEERYPGLAPISSAIDWGKKAATVTFYLAPVLLRDFAHSVLPQVAGALVWVHREEHAASLPPTVSPALLVHAVSTALPTKYAELVPHLHAGDPLLHHIVLVLQATINADSAVERLYAEELTNALAVHLLRRYAACRHTAPEMTGGLSPAKLRRTIVYIHEHLEQELSLTTLAAVVHLSPDHFARLFKQATGQTPHQYVLGCRIVRAKQLLAETDMPLSAIGLEVGCTDQSYFTALFRKHVAMTPKAYRDVTAGA